MNNIFVKIRQKEEGVVVLQLSFFAMIMAKIFHGFQLRQKEPTTALNVITVDLPCFRMFALYSALFDTQRFPALMDDAPSFVFSGAS
jgi:hypothetical protein